MMYCIKCLRWSPLVLNAVAGRYLLGQDEKSRQCSHYYKCIENADESAQGGWQYLWESVGMLTPSVGGGSELKGKFFSCATHIDPS